MLGAAKRLMEQGSVLKTMVFTLIAQAVMLQWRGTREKVFSLAVRMCTGFEKQPRAIRKGKPATQRLLQSCISICMLLKPRDCSPTQSGKKTSEDEARDGNYIFRDCFWDLIGSNAVTFRTWFFQIWSLHKFVWFGMGKGAVYLFSSGLTENFQGDAPVDAACSIISHKKQDWSSALLFSQNCWPRVCKSLNRCLLLENFLSTTSMLCRASL